MRVAGGVLVLILCAGLAALPARAADRAPQVVLAGVTHALDGSMLVITGWVHNRGAEPVARLVIDALGFSPAGDLTAFGSDGIPWEVQAGGVERFAVRLPVLPTLVRDYVVQASRAGAPVRPLAGIRRGVAVELYRPLLLTVVQVDGAVHAGMLTVRSRVAGLPILRVTAEAAVVAVQPKFNQLQHLTLDVPADGAVAVMVGGRDAFLVTLRLVDVLTKVSWE